MDFPPATPGGPPPTVLDVASPAPTQPTSSYARTEAAPHYTP